MPTLSNRKVRLECIVTLLVLLASAVFSGYSIAAVAVKKKAEVIQPTFGNVSYGPNKSNVLDFWQAESVEPTPVLIFFHGGGFVSGDKSSVNASLRAACLGNGISVVSANYRLIPDGQFPDFMLDGARVIQYVRSMAVKWHINPDKVALGGGSAGANMSIWLGLHDDLADPKAADPIARLSTRVTAVLSFNGQTSNDPQFILRNIGGGSQVHPSVYGFYGVRSLADMDQPSKQELAHEASAINFATTDDPPVYLTYEGELLSRPHAPDTPVGMVIHSPRFGLFLKEKMDALGVECVFYHAGNPDVEREQVAFLLKHLKS